jgi:mono/diheme cytochrome c family protein
MINARRIIITLVTGACLAATMLVLATGGGAATSASPNTPANKAFFKKTCGSCHTLKAAGTHGAVGPNLNTTRPSLARIITQITQGGRFMPAFGMNNGGSLTPAQIKAVAQYVVAVR